MFTISKDANPNYLATITTIGEVFPIEGADRIVRTVVNGFDMIVSKDMVPGTVVVYFPVETALSPKFLSANNLYELGLSDMNRNFDKIDVLAKAAESEEDPVKKSEIIAKMKSMCGFFGKAGRVRILKLKGQYSQGFIASIDSIITAYPDTCDFNFSKHVGTQFDSINGELVCWKYIPPVKNNAHQPGTGGRWKHRMKALKKFDRIIEGTFKFHYDTKMLAEHIHEIKPDDVVTITTKLHGTSAIYANILTNRKLSVWEKIKKFFGADVQTTEYGNIYSSRTVIKNQYLNPDHHDFYGTDVWGAVGKVIFPYIDKDTTVYGEIVGYVDGTSKFIQPQHDYGCKPGKWKFMPYRIVTHGKDEDFEWDVPQVHDWTVRLISQHPELAEQIMPIDILYRGPLKDIYPDIPTETHWHENVLARMKQDKDRFKMELDEPLCKNKVPREGIVVRVSDDKFPRAWKLKTARHYGKEAEQHDKGEVDMEEMA